jgi:two-component system OmpR family response regulator
LNRAPGVRCLSRLPGERIVAEFGWIAEHCEPPPQWDLRRIGWSLANDTARAQVRLVDARCCSARCPHDPGSCVFVGVGSGRERARLFDAGCGDALPARIGLPELARRARRVAERGNNLPRRLAIRGLTLDLLHRDARAGEHWLALHPREFALLWRLAEQPGEAVSRATLLRDVWRLDFEPGTNSVEVHVSRLRSKLAAAGIADLVETDRDGGYRLGRSPLAPGACAEPFARRLCGPGFSC